MGHWIFPLQTTVVEPGRYRVTLSDSLLQLLKLILSHLNLIARGLETIQTMNILGKPKPLGDPKFGNSFHSEGNMVHCSE